MNKLFFLASIIFFFNCASGQDTKSLSNDSFSTNNVIKSADSDELIYQLNSLEGENFESSLPAVNTPASNLGELVEFEEITNLINEIYPPQESEKSETPTPSDNQSVAPPANKKKTLPAQPSNSAEVKASPSPERSMSISGTAPLSLEQERQLKNVKTLYQEGKFQSLFQIKLQNNEEEALYYQALGVYNFFKKKPEYRAKNLKKDLLDKKKKLIKNAKDNLYQVGKNSTQKALKERAIFWYGILSLSYPNNPRDEKELTRTFLYIENNMKDSNVYNDSLIYLTMIYKKLGKIAQAKEYYRKAIKTSPDDLVYNYKSDNMVAAKTLWKVFDDLKN